MTAELRCRQLCQIVGRLLLRLSEGQFHVDGRVDLSLQLLTGQLVLCQVVGGLGWAGALRLSQQRIRFGVRLWHR